MYLYAHANTRIYALADRNLTHVLQHSKTQQLQVFIYMRYVCVDVAIVFILHDNKNITRPHDAKCVSGPVVLYMLLHAGNMSNLASMSAFISVIYAYCSLFLVAKQYFYTSFNDVFEKFSWFS